MCVCVCDDRQECKKLREELREVHEENRQAALAQLAQTKDQEMSTAREGWQRKVEDLLEQVIHRTHTHTHTHTHTIFTRPYEKIIIS